MCCKMLEVEELNKPMEVMCKHACSSGCGIYETRPEPCKIYSCLWLQSQTTQENIKFPLAPELRPDRCGVVFDQLTTNDNMVVARVLPHQRHKLKAPVVQNFMAALFSLKVRFCIVSGSKRKIIAAAG